MLGWASPTLRDGRQDSAAIAGHIKRVNLCITRDPKLYTLENLSIAVEYCRRKRLDITHPTQVFAYVKTALARSAKVEPLTDVGTQRQEALEYEMGSGLEDDDYWIERLSRAQGPGLLVALSAWRARRFPENARK